MEQTLSELPPAEDTWMVGDTGKDITAKNHGVKVWTAFAITLNLNFTSQT